MRVEIFGKQGCDLCKSAIRKLTHLVEQWNIAAEVPINFVDVETEDGAARGDFYDVFDIPTVLLLKDEQQVLARWDKHFRLRRSNRRPRCLDPAPAG